MWTIEEFLVKNSPSILLWRLICVVGFCVTTENNQQQDPFASSSPLVVVKYPESPNSWPPLLRPSWMTLILNLWSGPPRCKQNTLLNRWPPVTPYFLLMSQCSSHSDLYNKRNLKNKEEEEMLDDSRRSNQATELRLTNDRQPITYKWLSTKYSLITKITRIPPSSHTHSHTYRHRATHTPTLTRTHTHTHFSHCSPRVRNTEVGASDGENGHSTLNLTLLWAQ